MEAIAKISSILKVDQKELEKESIKTYLRLKLRRCESEIFNINLKIYIKKER